MSIVGLPDPFLAFPDVFLLSKMCTRPGTKKARVFPEPVSATPTTSRPVNMSVEISMKFPVTYLIGRRARWRLGWVKALQIWKLQTLRHLCKIPHHRRQNRPCSVSLYHHDRVHDDVIKIYISPLRRFLWDGKKWNDYLILSLSCPSNISGFLLLKLWPERDALCSGSFCVRDSGTFHHSYFRWQ